MRNERCDNELYDEGTQRNGDRYGRCSQRMKEAVRSKVEA